MNRFLLFVCGLFLVAFFSGCASKNRMELVDGTFDTPIPKENHGVGREIPAHSSLYGFSVSGNYFIDREVEMSARNRDTSFSETVQMPDSKADVDYNLPEYNVSVDFNVLNKYETVVAGFGGGLQMGSYYSFYLQFMLGVNRPHYEFGVYANAAFASAVNGSYRGYMYYAGSCEMGICQSPYKDTSLSTKEHRLQPFGTWGAFAGAYFGPMGLNVSVAYISPWMGSEDDLELNIVFPGMISLYSGLSFWIGDSWKVSAGPTFFFGGKDPVVSMGGALEFWI